MLCKIGSMKYLQKDFLRVVARKMAYSTNKSFNARNENVPTWLVDLPGPFLNRVDFVNIHLMTISILFVLFRH